MPLVQPSFRSLLVTQGVLTIVGTSLAIVMWRHIDSESLKGWEAVNVAFGGVILILARMHWDWSSCRLVSLLFLVNLLPVGGMLWVSQEKLMALRTFWVPFQAHALSCLTVALLAPPRRWAGVVGILYFVGLAVIQFLGFQPEYRVYLPDQALFPILAYGAFAVVIYLHLLRVRRIEIDSASLRAETDMLRTLKHTILAIRDLANSPIQAITVDASLLQRDDVDTRMVAQRMSQSVRRLHELNRLLEGQLAGAEERAFRVDLDSRRILLRRE